MTAYDVHAQVLQNLARLGPLGTLTPDPARAARVRARCRTQLQRRSQHRTLPLRFRRRILARVVVLGLCAVYLASLVSTVLRLRGLF
jgi:hypothetical protein